MTDDQLAGQLKQYFDGLVDHDINSYRKVSAQLSKLNQLMTPQEAAFVRREFLRYFES